MRLFCSIMLTPSPSAPSGLVRFRTAPNIFHVFQWLLFSYYLCFMNQQITEQQAIEERQKYVAAFNDTMIKIWKEQITLLGVIDTGRLLRSPIAIGLSADSKCSQIKLSQAFIEYGLWQDYGTGGEVPRGNSGDLGRAKKRQRRRWFSRKYYASVMNIKEFMADSLGQEFLGVISSAFYHK